MMLLLVPLVMLLLVLLLVLLMLLLLVLLVVLLVALLVVLLVVLLLVLLQLLVLTAPLTCRYHGRASVYSFCVLNWSLPVATFPSGLKQLSADLGKPWYNTLSRISCWQ